MSMCARSDERECAVGLDYRWYDALATESPEVEKDYTCLPFGAWPDLRDRRSAKVDKIGVAMTDVNWHLVGLKRCLTCS